MTSLTLVRRIAARPSIVFEALTTAERVCAWWGPDDLPVIRAEIDAQVGGAYRVRFQTLDGLEHEAFGEYLEIDPPRRLVMSWRYAFLGTVHSRNGFSPVRSNSRSATRLNSQGEARSTSWTMCSTVRAARSMRERRFPIPSSS